MSGLEAVSTLSPSKLLAKLDANTTIVLGNSQTALSTFSVSTITPRLQVLGIDSAAAALGLAMFSATANTTPQILMSRSRGATIASYTAVAVSDILSRIKSEGSDGTDFAIAADIRCTVDNTVANNQVPGRIGIFTTSAAGTLTEAIRINSAQQVAIGIATYVGSERLRVAGGTIAAPTATDVMIGGGELRTGATTDSTSPTSGSVTLAGGLGFGVTKSIFGGGFKSVSPTLGIGYAVGAGGAVTQATDKTTGVTLNTASGAITMNNAGLATLTGVGFTLTNSVIAATDTVIVNIKSGATADAYTVTVDAVAAGSCRISIRNHTLGTLSEAVVLNFSVIKAVAS